MRPDPRDNPPHGPEWTPVRPLRSLDLIRRLGSVVRLSFGRAVCQTCGAQKSVRNLIGQPGRAWIKRHSHAKGGAA